MLRSVTFGAIMYCLSNMCHKLFEIRNLDHSHHDHGTWKNKPELIYFNAALAYKKTVLT